MAAMSTMANSPPSLPTFVFPARAPSPATPSASRGGGIRRPMSNPPELPSFSFHSAATGNTSPNAGPQLSPNNDNAMPSGHRRATSEFVGGDGRTATAGGLMTAGLNGDRSLPSSAAKRGHAHRRSQAISVHDLKMILPPSTLTILPRGGSAPTTPSAKQYQTGTVKSISGGSDCDDATPTRELNRARVGFSDDVQIIPRPLSLVSDASSTVTIRQSHSVSESMSSVLSTGTMSPTTKDHGSLSTSPVLRTIESRPRTAGDILDSPKKTPQEPDVSQGANRRGSVPALSELSPESPSSPNKKWSFFGTSSGDTSPSRSRPVSTHEVEMFPAVADTTRHNINTFDAPMDPLGPVSSRRSSVSRKSSKKPKKVKSWAGSILSRRSHPRSQKKKTAARRSPTPPTARYPEIDQISMSTAEQSTSEGPMFPKPEIHTDFASWKPRQVPPPEDDSMSPIIDLDAALGPFNTPSGYDAEWKTATKSSSSKRRMHSAVGMGGFTGPGMHYHRRAESAPEMESFDYPRFGIHRLGSNSTMADVFEEDEEDEWEDAKASSDKESIWKPEDEELGAGIGINIVDADDRNENKTMDWTNDNSSCLQRGVKRKGSGLSEGERQASASIVSENSGISSNGVMVSDESESSDQIVDDFLSPSHDARTDSSDSTATPQIRLRPAKVDIRPFSHQLPFLSPTSPYSMTQSSISSPRSPYQYDPHRISTSPSSVTDEQTYEYLLLGEPGPDIRLSVDEAPSLASSNSATTRESLVTAQSPTFQFRDGQRSASLSSPVVTRKRSSMASLSRLISSSHGEKSKLSIESRPSTMEGDKKDKDSKQKRLSRALQFWKPKGSP